MLEIKRTGAGAAFFSFMEPERLQEIFHSSYSNLTIWKIRYCFTVVGIVDGNLNTVTRYSLTKSLELLTFTTAALKIF
jgi:hypothetical protein